MGKKHDERSFYTIETDDWRTLSTADYMHKALSMVALRMREPVHVASAYIFTYVL